MLDRRMLFSLLAVNYFLLATNPVFSAPVSTYVVANNEWSIISLPASSPAGNSPALLFGDELPVDSYGVGVKDKWALFKYSSSDNIYTLVDINSNLQAGIGYWMIQITGTDVELNLPTDAIAFSSDSSVGCPLAAGCIDVELPVLATGPVWFLSGYPRIHPQPLSATRVSTDRGICSDGCTIDQAKAANILHNEFFRYVDDDYQLVTTASNLTAWDGFWMARPATVNDEPARWLIPITGTVKVAFTADQGTKADAVKVLELIAQEGAELLLLQGDFGYQENTANIWNSQINQYLGEDFPVLSVVGNHENFEWSLYKSLISNRIDRIDELSCDGDVGVKASCSFRGLHIVQVAAGVKEVPGVKSEDNYPGFISESFENSASPWRICSWHKNQTLMQTGRKTNDPGWGVYQACLDSGAMIATGHEHAYSRTHLLNNFETQSVAHTNSTLALTKGQSFAFVSGLGGDSVRPQQRGGEWWASIYTATQNATFGALFCTYSEKTADCYFKALNGAEPDQFKLIANVLDSDQ